MPRCSAGLSRARSCKHVARRGKMEHSFLVSPSATPPPAKSAARLRGQLFSSPSGSKASGMGLPACRQPSFRGHSTEQSSANCSWAQTLGTPRAVVRQSHGSQRVSQAQSAGRLRTLSDSRRTISGARAPMACLQGWLNCQQLTTAQHGSRRARATSALRPTPLASLLVPKHRSTPSQHIRWKHLTWSRLASCR